MLVVLGVTAIAAAPAQAAKYNSQLNRRDREHRDRRALRRSREASTTPGQSRVRQGSGAILGHNDFGPTVGEFHGTNKVFYNKGTLKTTLDGTGGPNTGPEGGLHLQRHW